MDEEAVTQHPEEWRPVVWLIGVMLLVEGVGDALSNSFGIWQVYQAYQQQDHAPADSLIVWTAWAAVCFLLAIGLFIAGIGLWRRVRWARRTAVVSLGCRAAVFILAAFTTPIYGDDSFLGYYKLSIIQPEYWRQMLGRLQPFTMITIIVMLLFLSAPAIRQYWGEKSHPDLPTRIAEWGRRRLPAGMQPLFQFLGLIFLCWGAGICLRHILFSYNFWSLAHDQIPYLPMSNAYLLPALSYLTVGIWLLWNRRWSRQAAMMAVGVDIAYLVYNTIHSIMSLHRWASRGWPLSATELLEPIIILLQLAIPIIILLLLRKASPLTAEGVWEAVPEG